jgi:hypothetical protein
MLRVNNINNAYIKRNVRGLYNNTQATPKSLFLDPAWDNSVDIIPGMVVMKTAGDNVTLINATGVAYGLAGIFEAPSLGITEVTNQGINAFPVWVLAPDAEFQIINSIGKAFDDTVTWTDPGDGTLTLVSAYTTGAKRGQLCPAGTGGAASVPIARLLRVDSSSSIVIGGLSGRVA